MNTNYHYDNLAAFIGQELGVSDWVSMAQSRIDDFANCTGDHQWIHTDVERCKTESPFGAPIAHGFLNLSLLGGLMMQMGAMPAGVSRLVNAGVNNVRFRQAVRAGAQVRARVSVQSAEENWRAALGERPVEIRAGDGLAEQAPDSLDLVLCNPPFHQQQMVGDFLAWRMFQQARVALVTGGELWIVGNRHLGYHAKLKRLFRGVEQVAATPKFVVLKAIK